jgi:calcineurin-like phosphoesterase family protein
MSLFFSADTHFFHKRIVEFARKSFATVEEMNETILLNWNRVVGPDDEVYHLGDVSFGNRTVTRDILYKLHGRIYLVQGNHDMKNAVLKTGCVERFEWVKDMYFLKVPDTDGPDGKTQGIVLCHFPILSWNMMHHGSWHLHGHTHGTLPVNMKAKRHDVGMDNNFLKPISYGRVKEIMSRRVFEPVDHHGAM